jgi:hypothetical protein
MPGKETVNDIPNLFGSLQKMKMPQVQSDIDFEVVNSYTTNLSGIYNIITVYYNTIVTSHMDSQG